MIVSAGSPEVGFGGVMSNVIPKEGGNDMSYYFYGNYTDEQLLVEQRRPVPDRSLGRRQ